MADNDVDVNEELLDYEDDPETGDGAAEAGAENGAAKQVRILKLSICSRILVNLALSRQRAGRHLNGQASMAFCYQ